MVTEERRQEVLGNRRTFQRLSMEIIQGVNRMEKMDVGLRGKEERYEILVHPLTEVEIAEAAQNVGLTLQDLAEIARAAKAAREAQDVNNLAASQIPNEKQIARIRFMQEVVSLGLEDPHLTPKEVDHQFPPNEQAGVFGKIMELSGRGREEAVEKFQSEPSQRPANDAGV